MMHDVANDIMTMFLDLLDYYYYFYYF